MKKSILFSMVAATAVLSVQAVESANIIGVQPVTDSTTEYLLIAVPWNDFGTGEDAVRVETLVNCDQLTTGDKLYVANGNKYDVYKVEGNQWVGCATATIGKNGIPVETVPPPTTKTVKRGNAVWLYRQNNTEGSKDTFYIVGQKPTTELTQVQVAVGSNLISVPAARDVLVKNITGGTIFDQIIVPGNGGSEATYIYTTSWKKKGETGLVAVGESDKITAGIGFWYVANRAITITL